MKKAEITEVVLPCPDLNEALQFFTERLGFRLDAVIPADNPAAMAISRSGFRIRLEHGEGPGRVELVESDPPVVVPEGKQSFVLTRMGDASGWQVGRAGMRYRDLVPDRQGGRFIASHIRIPEGGPVPDYVHYHKIRFQAIYCYRGQVEVAYEDQGPPLVMHEGDCVLQPPQIRHRVLQCSPGLEVIEIGCPAEHETRVDHDLDLPTEGLRPDREFSGQRFVHHVAASARWQPWRISGFSARDLGIDRATGGLAGMRVVRPVDNPPLQLCSAETELLFMFVLHGSTSLHREDHGPERLSAGDCCVVPAGMRHGLAGCSNDLQVLEVSLPGRFETVL